MKSFARNCVNNLLILFSGLCALPAFSLAARPDRVQKCATTDKECILNNINIVGSEMSTGNINFGLGQFDPFELGTIEMENNGNNSVGINIIFTNAYLENTKAMRATKLKGFGPSPAGKHSILFKGPVMYFQSNYNVSGNVLILPVKGNGRANMTLVLPEVKLTIHADAAERNGNTYLNVLSTELDLEFERIELHFDNLFNGDKVLGDSVNAFINENWKILSNELRTPLVKSVNKVFMEFVQNVFNATPYTDLFQI